MAELSTLARPYAKAAFHYAVDAGDLAGWATMLKTLAAVASDPTLEQLLDSPAYSREKQAQVLLDVCGDELDQGASNLVHLLADNRRLKTLPAIARQFDALKAEHEKTVDVELFVATEIDTAQQEKLVQALSGRLDRRVNVSVAVDKSLLGGVLVRAGDTIIDGSIRGRLNKLAEALNS